MAARPQVIKVVETALPAQLELLETELAKDIWDVRNIPGARYSDHRSEHLVNFTRIPAAFRGVVKQYIKFRLVTQNRSLVHCTDMLRHIQEFLSFFASKHPGHRDFQSLEVSDIEAYIQYLKVTPNHYGRQRSGRKRWEATNYPYHFLKHLKRIRSPIAPTTDIDLIFWPEHLGKIPQYHGPKGRPASGKPKFIPLPVLQQLDQYIHQLLPRYLPVAILLRVSGWRISDILNLRYDTCLKREFSLEKQTYQYSLVGDIPKTSILEHEIPITAEVAALIEAQCTLVKQTHSEAANPKHYLFPAGTRRRQGRPLMGSSVQDALNRLARTYEIKGVDGNIFHFGTHAFRHTKAVELINQGMPFVLVQKWMAHLSPEMTLVYAQILAETMRKEWEKVEAKVGVRFLEGKPTRIEGKQLQGLLTNNAFDPQRVREHRVNIKLPVGNCVKPKDFQCRFVELPCFNCPMHVLTETDLPWLLNYELQLLERIEVGKQAGNIHWVEANQKLLEEKVRPTITLLQQEVIVAREAQDVREYTAEEWNQRQREERA